MEGRGFGKNRGFGTGWDTRRDRRDACSPRAALFFVKGLFEGFGGVAFAADVDFEGGSGFR